VAWGAPGTYAFTIGPLARLRGTVAGAWIALGLDPPRISAFTGDGREMNAVADSSGRFELNMVAPHDLEVRASIAGSERWYNQSDVLGEHFVHVEPGAIVDLGALDDAALLVTLDTPGYQTGVASLILVDSERSEFTDAVHFGPGRSAFVGLHRGTYFLKVLGADGWLSQWFDGAADRASATPISVTDDESVVPITVHLVIGGTIRGHVDRPDLIGRATTVVLFDATTGDCARLQYTEPTTHAFRFNSLVDGDYRLLATSEFPDSCPDPLPSDAWWYPGTADADSADILSIRSGNTIGGLDYHIPVP
jgi:hypothetical protein